MSTSSMSDNSAAGVVSAGIGTINISGDNIVNKSDIVRVNNITYNRDNKLGEGCAGTFVYRGKFGDIDVAVKRVLPECFKYPHREASLLRESTNHPHVIRCFCTEQDQNFQYIALELCVATAKDYVEGRYDVSLITPLEILKQATSGLAHLHSLHIVHRDIKPSNVLLSMPNNRGEVRAMISDFGLCRKLQEGRMSFSRSSGITGTYGWMAPEMLKENERTTCAVDMFSLGCVFYYVLSEGKHPFGEHFKRQGNILSAEYRLSELKGDDCRVELSRFLISELISVNADERPPAVVVLEYPVFWDNAKILKFLKDASDRLEKTALEDQVNQLVEKNTVSVFSIKWEIDKDPKTVKYRTHQWETVSESGSIENQPCIGVATSNMIHNSAAGVVSTGTGTINVTGNIIVNKSDIVRFNQITYNRDCKLGSGCNGTFVYRGKFDDRDVAVKRVLIECYKYPNREVSLLRKSDNHPYVIRYFCMEQDEHFQYIALELCAATVQDYVEGRYEDVSLITPLEILQQATSGLAHLHSLDIVHRDIKPPNVLLSLPNNRGEVQAKICDFGLSRKLLVGRISFSRSSGIIGTEGWIAPEILKENKRTTRAVDMFSLGCLFYYVLSDGKHPFGEPFKRYNNILSGEYTLSELKGDEFRIELSRMLISKLISDNAVDRPPAEAVLECPLFWDNARILGFFQDVSDRLERTTPDDPVIQALEEEAASVVRGDWLKHMTPEVAQDLRRHRKYQGGSVRDLLRAIRNKKHHYREFSPEAKDSLGSIPDQFTSYWTSRFPQLLLRSWLAMQCVKKDTMFKDYYPRNFEFIENSP